MSTIPAWDREAPAELRGAVARRGIPAIRTAVADRNLDAVLQLAGDGLLADASDALARDCAERLRRRDRHGDAELADALERRPDDLRPLAVDLEELAFLFNGDPFHGGGRIDLTTGDVWPQSPYDDRVGDEEADLDGEDRWLWVEASSHDGWWDMSEFIETVSDPVLGERLHRAIHGRGALPLPRRTLRAPGRADPLRAVRRRATAWPSSPLARRPRPASRRAHLLISCDRDVLVGRGERRSDLLGHRNAPSRSAMKPSTETPME